MRAIALHGVLFNMKKFAVLLSVLISFNSFSADYQQEINNFFDLYKKDKIEEAVDSIYGSNEYVTSIPDQIKNVKTQLKALKGLVGELNHLGKLDTYVVGDSFVHVTYLATYDRQPVRYEFQFFKVKSGWRIYSFSFDDDLSEIQKQARKAAWSGKN